MFRSIQHTITNRVIRDEVILYFVGIMIGIGGFAEATLAGMGMYVLVVFARPPLSHNLLVWSKDIAVVAIGLLLLVYWSYVDPHSLITSVQPAFCRINSNEGLSATEGIKIVGTTIFGISCNHSTLKMLRKLFCGVAIGLSFYVIPTIMGSIALQGFRGGGDKIFDIFSGNIGAQSTTSGYIVIMMIGILGTLKKQRLLILSIGLAFITGVQTSNRSVILFGVLGCIIEAIMWLKSRKSTERYYLHSIKNKKLLFFFGTLLMASLTLTFSSQFINSRITAALDGRLGLYIKGYSQLFDYLLTPANNLLGDAGKQLWWHSVPLDATRAANLSGAYLSLAWLAILITGVMMCLIKGKAGMCLLSFALLFIYMTGMPLAAGGYELVALYCGYLLLSNELVTNTKSLKYF